MGIEFKIDDEKLRELGYFFKTKSDELESLYKDILGICNQIGENYVGRDSTIYINRFKNNLNKLLKENEYLREGGFVLDDTTQLYTNQEDKWAKDIAKSDLNEEVIE